MKLLVPLSGKLQTTINANQTKTDAIEIQNTYGAPLKLKGYSFFFKAGLGGVQAEIDVQGLRKSKITDPDTPIAAMGCTLDRVIPAGQMSMPWPDGFYLQDNKKIVCDLKTAATAANADEIFLVFYAELDE